jgi:calcineurin-like phosphoesterase family protein
VRREWGEVWSTPGAHWLSVTRYLISDLHLDHAKIIDYCDRPFEDVAEMNETFVGN